MLNRFLAPFVAKSKDFRLHQLILRERNVTVCYYLVVAHTQLLLWRMAYRFHLHFSHDFHFLLILLTREIKFFLPHPVPWFKYSPNLNLVQILLLMFIISFCSLLTAHNTSILAPFQMRIVRFVVPLAALYSFPFSHSFLFLVI